MAAGADIRAGRSFVELFLKDSLTRSLGLAMGNAKKQLQQLGQSMTALGTQLATAGVAVLTPLGLSAKRFMEFDDEMRQVKAVSQATADEFARLTEVAKQLGATTSFTAVEVAGLMAELGRAGFNPKQIEEMTGAVLDLARASKTDAVEASGIMAATIRQFGLDATDAARVADTLTATANKTFNSVTDLGEALKYAGPVARDLGLSLEQTLAVLGGLGNVGIQGEMAGTMLRRLGILAATEGEKIKEAFGVDTTDAEGNLRPMVDVLREVVQAAQAMPSGKRVAIFDDIFGKQGITGAGAVGRAALDIKKLEAELLGLPTAGGVAVEALTKLGDIAKTEGEKIKAAFGVDVKDSSGNLRPTLDILKDIAAATKDGAPTDGPQVRGMKPNQGQGELLGKLLGKENLSTDEIAAFKAELAGVAGVARSTAAEMDGGLGGSFRILVSSIEGVAIAIGESLAPTLKSIADYVSTASAPIIKFIKENQEIVVTIAKVAAGVIAAGAAFIAVGLGATFLATVIGGFISIVAFAKAVIVGITAVLISFASPWALVIALVTLAVVSFFKLTDAGKKLWASMKESLGGMIAFTKKVFGGIANAIKEGDLARAGDIVMAALNVAFQEGIATLKGVWIDFKFWMAQLFDDMGEGFKGAWGKITHQVAAEIIGVRGLIDPTFDADAAMTELDKDRNAAGKSVNEAYEKRKADRDAERLSQKDDAGQAARDAREDLDNLINPKPKKKFDPFTDPDYLPPADKKKMPPLLKAQGGNKKDDAPITAATIFQSSAAFAVGAKFSGGFGTKKEAGQNVVDAIQKANDEQAKRDKELKDAVKEAVPKTAP